MQTNNRFFDDLARLATGAAGAAASLRGEAEASMRAWLERQLASFDLVTREEFEVVEAMAQKARAENDALKKRVDALESAIEKAATAPKKAPSRAKSSATRAKAAPRAAKKAD